MVIAWTYGKLKNRIQFITGINESKMSIRTGDRFPYDDDDDDDICFAERLQHNYIQIDVIDRIWSDYRPINWKFTEEENLKLPNRRNFLLKKTKNIILNSFQKILLSKKS
jgi:hypothetical protein